MEELKVFQASASECRGVGKDWEAGDLLKLWLQFWQFCSLSLTKNPSVKQSYLAAANSSGG